MTVDVYRPVRRIVTCENAEGRSEILWDGPAPNWINPPGTASVAHVAWATGEGCAVGEDPAPAGHPFGFHSPKGSILRIVDFAPDEKYDTSETQKFLDRNHVRENGSSRHFMFHKTDTLDYAIVIEGEIYAMLDIGETLMRAGDVLIQRGTNHSWSNRSSENCRVAFVLLANH